MRWITIGTIAMIALVAQVAWAPRLELFGCRGDALLIATVFLGLHARTVDAIVGGWIMGLAADLMSLEQLGLMALSYSLVALFTVSVREYLFCFRASTRAALLLLCGLMLRVAWQLYVTARFDSAPSFSGAILANGVPSAIMTAVGGALIMALLTPVAPLLDAEHPRFSRPGRRVAGGYV